MNEISIIGLDLAKNVFQIHGAGPDGKVVLRKKLNRGRLLEFFASLPSCVVAMEACASAHYWGREIGKFGHDVRLINPSYVKPFLKRQKNDAADAEAIAEAASRPTMRFVGVKSAEKQASSMAFKVRDLLVRQRTQTINALRGHLMEYGLIVAQGIRHIPRLKELMETYHDLPDLVRGLCQDLLKHIESLSEQIAELEKGLRVRAREDDVASRLMTIPGIGAICATAMEALAPSAETFSKGRDFAAWIGLTPKQNSSGGKDRLGQISRMGQRDLRRLLVLGATAVVRWARRYGAPAGSWLARMVSKKPPKLIAVALANKMARIAWALMAHGGVYQAPASGTA
ncbi:MULTISPECIES: IS110 family transposase [unclassified Bradyrhizobium]|uniref:IS110 family transposase n=1 Tax=unclassified Bradyrhizobium TaxID=2631580 RepID=UPI0020B2FD54|nr:MULTISPECIES: IS110 family transposase [unclassified Bradyrhizobium]MCP3468345.1 IS110 family transposase [Bradyrhizobium sp. CCGUVB23]MCP3476012.1 IS110 family transposase [Bradyrhizobium sp. CCGUVB1N3]